MYYFSTKKYLKIPFKTNVSFFSRIIYSKQLLRTSLSKKKIQECQIYVTKSIQGIESVIFSIKLGMVYPETMSFKDDRQGFPFLSTVLVESFFFLTETRARNGLVLIIDCLEKKKRWITLLLLVRL